MNMKVRLETFLQEVTEKTVENNQHPVLTSSKSGLYLQSDYFNKHVASKDNIGYKIIKKLFFISNFYIILCKYLIWRSDRETIILICGLRTGRSVILDLYASRSVFLSTPLHKDKKD